MDIIDFLGIVGIICLLAIGFQSSSQNVKNLQKNAVEHNAAHWEINTDGTTKFVWNNEIKK